MTDILYHDVYVIPTGRSAFWELQFVPPILLQILTLISRTVL